jgi:hypothetical protein
MAQQAGRLAVVGLRGALSARLAADRILTKTSEVSTQWQHGCSSSWEPTEE